MSPFHKLFSCWADPTVEAVCQPYLQKHIVSAQRVMNVKIMLSFPLGDSKDSGQKNRHNNLSGSVSLIVLQTERSIFRRLFVCARRSGSSEQCENYRSDKIITNDTLHAGK